MRISLTVPNNTRLAALLQPWQDEIGGKEIGEIAALAEELGFHRLTVGEHFAIPTSHVAVSGAHYVHSTTALAFLAGHTSSIRVSSNVSLVPLQHPVVQAKQWATLDWLSGGRTDLVVGVGWLKEEFDVLGVDFHRRGRIVDEYVAAMQEIWSSDVATFKGEFVQFDEIAADPKPLQTGGVPLIFAGDTAATFRRIARFGVGWSPFQTPPDGIEEGIDRIKSDPSYRGQAIDVFYSLTNLRVGEAHASKADDHDFDTWDSELLVDQISRFAERGVTDVALPIPNIRSYEHYRERLQWIAEEIMPKVDKLGPASTDPATQRSL